MQRHNPPHLRSLLGWMRVMGMRIVMPCVGCEMAEEQRLKPPIVHKRMVDNGLS